MTHLLKSRSRTPANSFEAKVSAKCVSTTFFINKISRSYPLISTLKIHLVHELINISAHFFPTMIADWTTWEGNKILRIKKTYTINLLLLNQIYCRALYLLLINNNIFILIPFFFHAYFFFNHVVCCVFRKI